MNIKARLIGAFDLLFLFGRGIEAFSGTRRDALLSFLIPVAFFPLSLVFSHYYPPKGMETGYSTSQVITIVIQQSVFSLVFSLALIAGLAKAFKKLDKLWLYLEASNWTGLTATIVTLPLVLAAIFGWVQREEMDRIFVIVQCYLYVVTACIMFRSFQLHWQLAGFMAIVVLFADQTAWNILFRMEGIPKPW